MPVIRLQKNAMLQFKAISTSCKFHVEKRKEASCHTASICLLICYDGKYIGCWQWTAGIYSIKYHLDQERIRQISWLSLDGVGAMISFHFSVMTLLVWQQERHLASITYSNRPQRFFWGPGRSCSNTRKSQSDRNWNSRRYTDHVHTFAINCWTQLMLFTASGTFLPFGIPLPPALVFCMKSSLVCFRNTLSCPSSVSLAEHTLETLFSLCCV